MSALEQYLARSREAAKANSLKCPQCGGRVWTVAACEVAPSAIDVLVICPECEGRFVGMLPIGQLAYAGQQAVRSDAQSPAGEHDPVKVPALLTLLLFIGIILGFCLLFERLS